MRGEHFVARIITEQAGKKSLRPLPGPGTVGPLLAELGLNGIEQCPVEQGRLRIRQDVVTAASQRPSRHRSNYRLGRGGARRDPVHPNIVPMLGNQMASEASWPASFARNSSSECCCHAVAFAIASTVVPLGLCSIASTFACLLTARTELETFKPFDFTNFDDFGGGLFPRCLTVTRRLEPEFPAARLAAALVLDLVIEISIGCGHRCAHRRSPAEVKDRRGEIHEPSGSI
jgi:hypothetical protein